MSTQSSNSSGFPLKPYTVAQLSDLYGVSKKTFRSWIEPIQTAIGERQGHFYNIGQVKTIVSHLGIPGSVALK